MSSDQSVVTAALERQAGIDSPRRLIKRKHGNLREECDRLVRFASLLGPDHYFRIDDCRGHNLADIAKGDVRGMPDMGLSPAALDQLVAFLETLK